MGYWSGVNAMHQSNHEVGTTTDAQGIVGEVKLICQSQPSTSLAGSAILAYAKLDKAGR